MKQLVIMIYDMKSPLVLSMNDVKTFAPKMD